MLKHSLTAWEWEGVRYGLCRPRFFNNMLNIIVYWMLSIKHLHVQYSTKYRRKHLIWPIHARILAPFILSHWTVIHYLHSNVDAQYLSRLHLLSLSQNPAWHHFPISRHFRFLCSLLTFSWPFLSGGSFFACLSNCALWQQKLSQCWWLEVLWTIRTLCIYTLSWPWHERKQCKTAFSEWHTQNAPNARRCLERLERRTPKSEDFLRR